MTNKIELDRQYWERLRDKSLQAGITLDDRISPADFRVYGDRLGDRLSEMFAEYGTTPLGESTVVDVGCGMGRISLPFSKRFKSVIGIDVNRRILDAGAAYCRESSNIRFIENDGRTIPLPDRSVEYVFSGGVLQHIKDIDVIKGYFHEGLRVLKPNGLLNYIIQTWIHDVTVAASVGARIKASDIEEVLAAHDCELLALLDDPLDPIPHMNIIVRLNSAASGEPRREQVHPSLLKHRPLRTGIWEDLETYRHFHQLWAGKRRSVTFWD